MTIYFGRAGNIHSGTRAQLTQPFTGVASLDGVNTLDYEGHPALTADALTLFLETSSSAGFDIHIATRTSTAAIFSAHAPVAVTNKDSTEIHPWISDDGLVMYFSSNRAVSFDIFKTTRVSASSAFSAPVAANELNMTTVDELAPILSKDGLKIFFARSDTNPLNNDIFHAKRSTLSDGFGIPTLVAELNGGVANWVSPDRCQLMFTSNREEGNGGNDIWIATRPQ